MKKLLLLPLFIFLFATRNSFGQKNSQITKDNKATMTPDQRIAKENDRVHSKNKKKKKEDTTKAKVKRAKKQDKQSRKIRQPKQPKRK
jgi:hypothetical protein